MGKKGEKTPKAGGPASANSRAEDSSTPEPYNCTGNFAEDFLEVWLRTCQEKDLPPDIKPRGRPPSPTQAEEKTSPQGEEEETPQNEEPTALTYSSVDRNIFFKPSIQCEFDIEETKQAQINHIQQIYIRGWRVEEKLITVLKMCMLDRLTTLNLWHAGLTDHTFGLLTNSFPALTNVKTVVIEGNALPHTEPFSDLLNKDMQLHHLSLRNNQITDFGAEKIGKALGSANSQGLELSTLNLAFNHISDEGANHIATGLRMNRTLTSLSLASNKITDVGVQAISATLQWFTLNHEEVVQRRKLMYDRGMHERRSSGLGSRHRGDSKDRPGSNRSGSQVDRSRGGRASSKKRDGGKPDKTAKKDEGRGKKEASKMQSKISIGETPKNKGRRSGGKDAKRGTTIDVDSPDMFEHTHPLLDSHIVHEHGKVYVPGCFTLLSLNLSRNQIGEIGMRSLLRAVKHQAKQKEREVLTVCAPGLLKLSLQKNRVPHDSETYCEILRIMQEKDPTKQGTKTPEDDLQSVAG